MTGKLFIFLKQCCVYGIVVENHTIICLGVFLQHVYFCLQLLQLLVLFVQNHVYVFDFFLFICNIYNETNCWLIQKMYKQRQFNNSI